MSAMLGLSNLELDSCCTVYDDDIEGTVRGHPDDDYDENESLGCRGTCSELRYVVVLHNGQ
jgi:hypothetical protein